MPENDFDFIPLFQDEGDFGDEEKIVEAPKQPENEEEEETKEVEVEQEDEVESEEVKQLRAKVAELEAQKVTLPAQTNINIEKPKSIVEEWKTKFKVDSLEDFGDAAELLSEIDRLRQEKYEQEVKLAELASHPTVRQAAMEKEVISEIQQKSNDWQSEFLDMYDRAEEIKKLSSKKAAELGDFIGTKVIPLMTARKAQGKSISNPLLAIQKEISAKLDELVAPKKPVAQPQQKQVKPPTQHAKQEQVAKKMMSLNDAGDTAVAPSLPFMVSKEDAAYLQKNMRDVKHLFEFAEDI